MVKIKLTEEQAERLRQIVHDRAMEAGRGIEAAQSVPGSNALIGMMMARHHAIVELFDIITAAIDCEETQDMSEERR